MLHFVEEMFCDDSYFMCWHRCNHSCVCGNVGGKRLNKKENSERCKVEDIENDCQVI